MNRIVLLAALAVWLMAAPAPVSAGSQPADATPSKTSAAATPLNLNTATAAQLEELPGIGPATAKRIIEYREKNGSFKKIEELMNVKGIGEKSFLKLKGQVTVAAPKK